MSIYSYDDYSDFLSHALGELQQKPSFSFASFAKTLGLASKGYVRDIFLGSKRVTGKTLPKFCRALQLDQDASRYFTLLVYKRHGDLNSEGLSTAQIEMLCHRLRLRKKSTGGSKRDMEKYDYFQFVNWPIIYAALGSKAKGAAVEQIAARSRFNLDTINKILESMVSCGAILRKKNAEGEERYFAPAEHFVFEMMGDREEAKRIALKTLHRSAESIKHRFGDKENIFYTAALSIDSKRFEEFQTRLHQLIHQFTEEIENPEGNRIADIFLSFRLFNP